MVTFFGSSERLTTLPGSSRGEREVELAAVGTAQIELVKLVAHDFAAALRRAVASELVVEKMNPAAVDFFRFGGGMGNDDARWLPYTFDDRTGSRE